jgi:hypothetical protein
VTPSEGARPLATALTRLPALELAPQGPLGSRADLTRMTIAQLSPRHYAAADSAADRAVALAPRNPRMPRLKATATLARGDLDEGRSVIPAAATRIEPQTLLPFLASYQDLYWVLDDEQQRRVLALPPSAFDYDRGNWGDRAY